MKFYDFSDYEYCALIGVSEIEKLPLDVEYCGLDK